MNDDDDEEEEEEHDEWWMKNDDDVFIKTLQTDENTGAAPLAFSSPTSTSHHIP